VGNGHALAHPPTLAGTLCFADPTHFPLSRPFRGVASPVSSRGSPGGVRRCPLPTRALFA